MVMEEKLVEASLSDYGTTSEDEEQLQDTPTTTTTDPTHANKGEGQHSGEEVHRRKYVQNGQRERQRRNRKTKAGTLGHDACVGQWCA